jgi:hypothetical protein
MKRKSAALALAVVVLSVTAVQALPTTYVYTGNPFTFVSGPYTTSDFVSGMVTLAGPLAPDTISFNVTPLAFSFSDGVQTITNQNASGSLFIFTTDGAGMIIQWIAELQLIPTPLQNLIGTAGNPGGFGGI